MQVQLVMFKSDGSRRDFPLTRGRIVIGRTNEVGLRIPLSSVSRKHCEIAIEEGVVKLRDLGSSNGTLHNSERVKEAVLSAGDQIEVGPVVFIVVIDGVPAEIEQVRSLVEQELVDTSVGLPAQNDDEEEGGAVDALPADEEAPHGVMEPGPSPHQKTPLTAPAKSAPKPVAAKPVASKPVVSKPAPVKPVAPPVVKEEEEVIGEVDTDESEAAPVVPIAAADLDEDPIAAAARAAQEAVAGESFSEGATVVDMDDPIAALERLAAAEKELADEFSLLSRNAEKSAKGKPGKK